MGEWARKTRARSRKSLEGHGEWGDRIAVPAKKGRHLPVRKQYHKGKCLGQNLNVPAPKMAVALRQTYWRGEAGGGLGLGAPHLPAQGSKLPGTEPRLPPGRAGALRPGALRGRGEGWRGGRGQGWGREDRGTSASRWLAGSFWRRRRERRDCTARGLAFPGPPPPHAARTMVARWGAPGW